MKTDDTRSVVRVALEKQTYIHMLYLLISFPLGLCYFAVLVAGILLGIGTLIIWIGVPILFLLITTWWYVAAFERSLAIRWLHVTIAPLSFPPSVPRTQWQEFQARLWNPMTWKILLFLLLKFPFGLVSFVLTVVLPLLSVAITGVVLVIWAMTAPFVALVAAFQRSSPAGRWLRQYFVLALTGFGLSLVTLHVLNGVAFLAGQWASLMLGMSQTAMHLQDAKARAAQARARAEQAEQRRRQLVVDVSHELRTPVASITAHLESLLMASEGGAGGYEPATLHRYLRIAHQEARRLGMLVDELLSLARMESDELQLDLREIGVDEVVEEVYQLLAPLALDERRVTLVRGVVPNLPPVLADRQRLVQVLVNLVRNAITSTPAGGIVSINLEPAGGDQLTLVVEDSGVGIAVEELEHIFERFYRTDSSRSRGSGGFGLGLAIAHDLITAMGGSITVESTVGQGSRFCVQLRTSLAQKLPPPRSSV